MKATPTINLHRVGTRRDSRNEGPQRHEDVVGHEPQHTRLCAGRLGALARGGVAAAQADALGRIARIEPARACTTIGGPGLDSRLTAQ
jgi:hypothetical protein